MLSTMMDYQLTLTSIFERARTLFPNKEIVTKNGASLERETYSQWANRVGRIANALDKLGVKRGDRVATFAWNNTRHHELYFAVPCMGAVLHPINLRLPPEQIIFIANHADDKVLFVDPSLFAAVEKLAPHLKSVQHIIVMGDKMPETQLTNVLLYENLIAAEKDEMEFPQLDEREAAAMCYTSGTTGNPKGVIYSHRSIYLHSLGIAMPNAFELSEYDIVLPIVPMFHVLAWGLPFACMMVGADVVFSGPHMQPRDVAELLQAKHVTFTAGVPTIWLGLMGLLESEKFDLSALRTMVVGGAAAPQFLIEKMEKQFGLNIVHAWGMTEMSPLGTVSKIRSHQRSLPESARFTLRAKQGMPVAGVDVRVVQEDGTLAPHDGKTFGELQVRGPWITGSYYNDERNAVSFADGWFRTGDVVTIDPDGFVQIVDRTKDLVKSGGEWISSVDLENSIMGHPKVQEAAVIAVPHDKWQERPLACVVPKPAFKNDITKEEILEHLKAHFSTWQLPNDVIFIEAVPKTSVGKFDKKVLRAKYQDYKLPN